MKLAIFWADLLHYHISRLKALIDLGAKSGHKVFPFVLSPKSPELPITGYQDLLGSHIKVLANDPQSAGPYSWTSKQLLLEFLDEVKPDVVAIIGYDGKVSRAALAWCRYHRKAAVLMFVSQKKDSVRRWWKEAFKSALVRMYDAALVGGSTHIDYAVELGMGRDRIYTGYNVVDNQFWYDTAKLAKAAPHLWRKRFQLPERFFLSAGRFIPKKNFEGLLRAYAIYVRQVPSEPWHLVIAGDGATRPKLDTLVGQLELTGKVHFPGYLPAQDMAPLYGLASAFILPSAFFEQWGLVVNEAMAGGLPVIVSEICGCAPDLVIDGVTGFKFNPYNEEQLADLMVEFTIGKFNLQKMGANAHQLVVDKYSPEVFAHNLLVAANAAIIHASSRRWQLFPPPCLWN